MSSFLPAMIGRASELDRLQQRLAATTPNDRHVVLISGEAGIGKTRLAAEATRWAAAQGFTVLKGACFPQDRGCPYSPLLSLLRARITGLGPEQVADLTAPYARDLFPLLPDLIPPGDLPPPRAIEPETARRRLFDALDHCLLASGSSPVLLVVEDLHWCDEASLDFLLGFARRTSGPGAVLLGTYRHDEVGARLRAWLGQVDRERVAEEIRLGPLSGDEVAMMVQALQQPYTPAPATLIPSIAALAEGNPLFVEELLKTAMEADGPRQARTGESVFQAGSLCLPRSIQAAVQDRVEHLSPAAREVLQLAAVIGRWFDFSLLRSLLLVDEHWLLSLIEELVAARLVVEESGERYAFRHALTQQAVYTALLTRKRMVLHRQTGEMTEQIRASSLDEHLEDLAWHFLRAGVWDKAQSYARRAGERALRLYAWQAAAEQFTHALEANARLAGSETLHHEDIALLRRTAAAVHRGRGRVRTLMGDLDGALADHTAAVELARAVGDAREECQALVDAGVAWAGRDYARAGECYRRALDLARGLDDPALLVQCLNRLANWHANTAQPHEAAALLRESLAMVERTGDRAGIAATLDWLGTATYLSRDLAGAIGYFDRAVTLFRDLDDRPLLASCLTMLATRGGSYDILSLEATADDVAAGVRDGEEALALAQANGLRAAEAFALVQLAVILGPRGEYGRALDFAQRALQTAEAIGHGQWTRGAHQALGALYLDLLAPAEALPHLERALTIARAVGSTHWGWQTAGRLAIAHLELHEPDRAAAILSEVPDADADARWAARWWATYARARLALNRRDPELALRLCDELRGPASGRAEVSDTPTLVRLRAGALAALGRTDEAETALRRVREAMPRQGTCSELWRTHAALGHLYRAADRAEDARLEFAAARAVIEQIAATVPDDRLRRGFLQHATAYLPRAYRLSSLSTAAARFGGLTAREREVAALIARGKANAEIAAALVLGRRTVETHIANIFTKLGVSSRREIADWVSQMA